MRAEKFRKSFAVITGAVVVLTGFSSCGPKESAMKKADLNGDGRISTGEMNGALVNAVFDQADRNKNGSVNYKEWRRIFPEMSEAEFAKNDLGGKGAFTREEALAHCDRKNTFGPLIEKIDTNGDGFIGKAEAAAFKERLSAAEGANPVQKLESLMN